MNLLLVSGLQSNLMKKIDYRLLVRYKCCFFNFIRNWIKIPAFNLGDSKNVKKALPNYPEEMVEKYNKTDLIPQKSPIDDKKLLHINIPKFKRRF